MKATITVLLAAFTGILLGTNIALATEAHEPPQISFAPDNGVPMDDGIPAPPEVTTLHELVVTVPTNRHVTRHKAWKCDAPHTMSQGPLGATVRECGWR